MPVVEAGGKRAARRTSHLCVRKEDARMFRIRARIWLRRRGSRTAAATKPDAHQHEGPAMTLHTKTSAMLLMSAFVLTGCATKGALREAVAEERAAWNAAVAAERTERMTADEQLAADLTALRNDLGAM